MKKLKALFIKNEYISNGMVGTYRSVPTRLSETLALIGIVIMVGLLAIVIN